MCWFIRYEFICFSQNDLSAWTELAGPSMNCAPNTLFEFPGAQECFISQFISPVCLCSFNFLPIEVHFCVRIPVKTSGIQAAQLWLSGGQCVGYSFSSCGKTVDSWEWDELPGDGSQGWVAGMLPHTAVVFFIWAQWKCSTWKDMKGRAWAQQPCLLNQHIRRKKGFL